MGWRDMFEAQRTGWICDLLVFLFTLYTSPMSIPPWSCGEAAFPILPGHGVLPTFSTLRGTLTVGIIL